MLLIIMPVVFLIKNYEYPGLLTKLLNYLHIIKEGSIRFEVGAYY